MSSWCAPAIRCTSCRDSSSQSVFVLYPPVRGAVIVDLASDDLAVRFFRDGGTYWEQLERVFAREGLCAFRDCGVQKWSQDEGEFDAVNVMFLSRNGTQGEAGVGLKPLSVPKFRMLLFA